MKYSRLLLKSIILFGAMASVQQVSAQSNVSGLIKSGPEDAQKLAQSYLNPLFKGLGIGLNSGWNYTANTKNTGRFEFRLSGTMAFVPDADKSFDVTKIGLSNSLRLKSGNPSAPTVSGAKTAGPEMEVLDDNGNPIETFTLPKGANLSFVPAAQLQGTIGLPRGIDLTIRGMPQVNMGDDAGKLSMIGGGIKVELLPMLTGKTASKILPFDLAVAFGYTQLNYELNLDVQPPAGSVPETPAEEQDFSTQMIDARLSAINTELIFSKKLAVFTPFISVGYNSSNTDAKLKGNYPIVTDADVVAGNTLVKYYTTFTDPVKIDKKDISGFRSNIGFQLNLAVFRLFAAYSLGEYNAVNAGIGLGIGK